MKRAHAKMAVIGGIAAAAAVAIGALFLGTERGRDPTRRVNPGSQARASRITPRTKAGNAAPGSVAPAGSTAKGDAKGVSPAHDEHAKHDACGPEAAVVEGDCDHNHGGPGIENPGEAERRYTEKLERAKELIEQGPAKILDALRGSDKELAKALVDALLDDAVALCEKDLLDGLLAWASDATASGEDRATALDLLGRSPGTGADVLAKLSEISLSDPDPAAREGALTAVRQLAMERDDLQNETRVALTHAAEKTTSSETRGDALSSIRTEHASAEELERIARFLADPDPTVRVATAIALSGTDAEVRGKVVSSLETAFARESDADSASAMAATVLRVARADAAALIERLARTDVARANPLVARQLDDYRSLLAEGETDPIRIERTHQEREDARAAAEAK